MSRHFRFGLDRFRLGRRLHLRNLRNANVHDLGPLITESPGRREKRDPARLQVSDDQRRKHDQQDVEEYRDDGADRDGALVLPGTISGPCGQPLPPLALDRVGSRGWRLENRGQDH